MEKIEGSGVRPRNPARPGGCERRAGERSSDFRRSGVEGSVRKNPSTRPSGSLRVSPLKKNYVRAQAVIFDMDGVITNTMPDHFRCWKMIFGRYGIRVTYLDIYSREGQKGMMSVKEIFAKYHKPLTPEQAQEILDAKEKLFKKIVKRRFIIGARSFLRFLHRKNIKLALVTGTSRHELHQILPDHLYNLFSVIVTGTDVKNGKPHPEPFLKALKLLKIKSSEAIVIENAPFGIQAAKKAGLRCLALASSLPKQFLHEADAVFLSIKEVRGRVGFEAFD